MQEQNTPAKMKEANGRTDSEGESVSSPPESRASLRNLTDYQDISEMISLQQNSIRSSPMLQLLMQANAEHLAYQQYLRSLANPLVDPRAFFINQVNQSYLLDAISFPSLGSDLLTRTAGSSINPSINGNVLHPDLYRALHPSISSNPCLRASGLALINEEKDCEGSLSDQKELKDHANTKALQRESPSLPVQVLSTDEGASHNTSLKRKKKCCTEEEVQGNKKKKQKKGKDMPTRPRTAYNFFFQDEREKLLRQIQDGNKEEQEANSEEDDEGKAQKMPSTKHNQKRPEPHGLIGFQELGKIIGKKWKTISPETKELYQQRAECDRQRYNTEMDLWKKQEQEKLTRKQAELERMVDLKTREKYLKLGGATTSSGS